MTPEAAKDHLLDAVEGLEITGGDAEVVDVLLGAASSYVLHALMRLRPEVRQFQLEAFCINILQYVAKIEAKKASKTNGHSSPYPTPELN